MTYRILVITSSRKILRDWGLKHERLIFESGEPTWYSPPYDPQNEAMPEPRYGVPPWGRSYLWEVDAPFPAGANPPSPPSLIVSMVLDNGKWMPDVWNFGDPFRGELLDFFRQQFPNQLD